MHVERVGSALLVLLLLGGGCGTRQRSRPPVGRGAAATPAPVLTPPSPRRAQSPRPRAVGRLSPRCAAAGQTGRRDERLIWHWNRFYRWLTTRGFHRLSYANSRQFTVAVGDAIRGWLRHHHRGRVRRAYELAIMLLGLRARTGHGGGSRWDCTTRMLQLTAQARKLASLRRISYTGYRRGRLQTIVGDAVYRGYHLAVPVITLMAVAHYKERPLARRNMTWRTPLLPPGGIWKPAHYGRLRVGDLLWYPDYGPGHFGTVLVRRRNFFVTVEGYWRGQPTVIHIYKRHAGVSDRCVRRALARLRGFAALWTGPGPAAPWATNVRVGLIDAKGPLRVGSHR